MRALTERVREVTDSASDVVYTASRSDDIERSRADVSRAREEFGFESSASLDVGLIDLFEPDAEMADRLL